MAYSKEDIAAALQRQGIDPETGESSYKQQIGQALEKQGIDPTGGLVGQLRTMGLSGYRKALQAVPLGARQESQRILGKIPNEAWRGYLAKGGITPAEQQTISQHPMEARAGRGLTDIAGYGAATALAPESVVGQAIGGAIGGGAVAPTGHTLLGAATGGLLPFAPKLAGLGLKGLGKTITGLPKMDIIFKSRLAKRLQEAKAAEEEVSAEHYSNTFKNTENFMPQLNNETQNNFNDLKKIYTTKHDPVKEAFDQYDAKPTLEKLHYLKSDLGLVRNKLFKKLLMPGGLSSTERGEHALLGKTMDNMQTDLNSNFNLLPENKSAQYKLAQEHYGNNVAPFKAYSSLRKLFGPRGKVSSPLYRDLAEHDKEAERLRNILGISRTQMNLGRFLHRKYISGGALALGAGLGMYAKEKL